MTKRTIKLMVFKIKKVVSGLDFPEIEILAIPHPDSGNVLEEWLDFDKALNELGFKRNGANIKNVKFTMEYDIDD